MSHDEKSTSTDGHLVYMANQIATFFATQPGGEQAERVADHINKFWEPRMRRRLFEIIDRGASGLSPLVLEAAAKIRLPQAIA